MATAAVMSGTLKAAAVGFGPTNTEFNVDKTSGQVDFKVGTPTPTVVPVFPILNSPVYSTLPSTNINATTKNVDSINILNNFLATYLLDSPPPVTNLTAVKDTTKISVSYTLPPQKRLAFSQTTAPFIKTVRADIILTSANAGQTFAGATTITLETPALNAFATASTLELYVQAGTSALVGTTYQYKAGIATQTSYDIRVYCVNESAEPTKYTSVFNVQTDGVGPPAAPTGLAISAITQTTSTASWTAPVDRDANLAGTQLTPFVGQYRVDRNTTSSARYGGAITDTVSSTTTVTTVSDSATTLGLTALQPGTNYSAVVLAKNTINGSFGAASTAATWLTLSPNANSYLSAADSTAIDATQLSTLRSPYLPVGGYTLGGTVAPTLLNFANMTNTNTYVTYSGLKRTNFTVGATGTVGSLVAYAGPSTTYTSDPTNKATFATQGFGVTSADGSVTSSAGTAQLVYRTDSDQYSSPVNSTGFYKVIDATSRAVGVATNYAPSATGYSLRLEYTPVGGSVSQTNQVEFFVDGLNAATTVNNVAITAESGSNTTQISGVPTFTSAATFKLQHNQTQVASYFVRNDRKHAELSITNNGGGTILGAIVPLLSTSMGASHKYYVAPSSNKYTTSATLSNTGTQLAYTLSPPEIQFNDFVVPLTAAASTYDEAIMAKVTPYSNYTNGGTPGSGGYVDPAAGTSKSVRIDSPSVTVKTVTLASSASALGQQVSSGSGAAPAKSAYTVYDHTQSLLSNSDLQLLNGRFVTPAGDAAAYKNYSTYWTGTGALPTPDYSSITSASASMRYVTFLYTGKILNGESKIQCALVSTGLTLGVNLSSANHTFTVLVDDPAQGTGNMNCNAAVAGTGVGAGAEGTPCGDVSTTVASRKFYIIAGASTAARIFIRIGIANNIAATITSCSLAAVTTFT
jgi:hypothetical protein